METFLPYFTKLFQHASTIAPQHYVILLINFLLFAYARKILIYFNLHEDGDQRFLYRLRVFRFLNLLVFILYGQRFFFDVGGSDWDFNLVLVLGILYGGYLLDFIVHYFIQLRFGKYREINGERRIIETYNTRLLGLLARTLIFVVVLVAVVRLLGFESLLEAGGVLGVIGVGLALTQNSWAPDIFSGLIILNSGAIEEGDVVELDGPEKIVGIVFKTKMFHTEILNLANNHRIMIRNFKLRDYVVHNLSKFASAKGLREQLHFNVGYDEEHNAVKDMFNAAYEKAAADVDVGIDGSHPAELRTLAAGDYAVEWCVFYYTKDVKRILSIRQKFTETIICEAKARGIDLATPQLNTLKMSAAAAMPTQAP